MAAGIAVPADANASSTARTATHGAPRHSGLGAAEHIPAAEDDLKQRAQLVCPYSAVEVHSSARDDAWVRLLLQASRSGDDDGLAFAQVNSDDTIVVRV